MAEEVGYNKSTGKETSRKKIKSSAAKASVCMHMSVGTRRCETRPHGRHRNAHTLTYALNAHQFSPFLSSPSPFLCHLFFAERVNILHVSVCMCTSVHLCACSPFLEVVPLSFVSSFCSSAYLRFLRSLCFFFFVSAGWVSRLRPFSRHRCVVLCRQG